TTLADGTVTTRLDGPDPRWSVETPLPISLITTTGGLTSTLTTTRTTTLADLRNPFSLTNLTDKITLNGRLFTSVYDATTKTATSTSAQGRQNKRTIDSFGRIVQAQPTGLLATNFSYDTLGRLNTITQGTGVDQRTATLTYNAKGYLDTMTNPAGQ